ncbi:ABC transporter substrate-binding protein, partial [Brevibacterium paucivorans]
ITLKANPNFWKGKPKVDTIQYTYYTNSDAMVQALRAGDVDFVTGLSPEQMKALENADNIETNVGESRRFTALGVNPGFETPEGEAYGTGNEALKDVKVRQALRLGIDMKTLREQVMQDYATEATSFVPESFEKWHLPKSDKIVSHDP